MKDLFDDQSVGMARIAQAFAQGHKRVGAKAPTGWGKTVVAAKMIRGAREKNRRVAFVVDSISLIDQTVERLAEEGITDLGVIQSIHPLTDYSRPVQIISAQTLKKRGWTNFDFNFVIIDEFHCWHRVFGDWMAKWTNVPFLGMSATPWKPGLDDHWDTLVDCGSVREMIDLGRLSPYRIFAVSHPDLTKVPKRLGDFQTGKLSEAMSNGSLVHDLVGKYKQHHNAGKTLVFCVDRPHAAIVQQEYLNAGVTCGYIDAHTDGSERKEIARQFHSGELEVVASVGCLTKGVDWDVRCIQLARPTYSEMLFMQIIGRGLRVAAGKEYCLILDHSDTSMRLGLPEEIEERNTGLIPGKITDTCKRDVDEPESKMCTQCKFMKPPKTQECPVCGHLAVRQTRQSGQVEADLEEMIPAAKRRINRTTTKEEKMAFMGGLKAFAQAKGYKPGWAANQYREKFGVWPNAFKDAPVIAPNESVKGWIKHKRIQYAKKRSAA